MPITENGDLSLLLLAILLVYCRYCDVMILDITARLGIAATVILEVSNSSDFSKTKQHSNHPILPNASETRVTRATADMWNQIKVGPCCHKQWGCDSVTRYHKLDATFHLFIETKLYRNSVQIQGASLQSNLFSHQVSYYQHIRFSFIFRNSS